MSEIVNCQYSKTIMDEPTCNAFDVNRYGEIICSEENCIILKLKEQLQAKEQECEEFKERLIKISGKYKDTLSIVEDMAIFLGLDKKDHFNICQCYYTLQDLVKELKELKQEKAEIKKYLGIPSKTIMQRLEKLQEFKDEASDREYRYKEALDEIEKICQIKEGNSQFVLPSVWQQILDIIHKAKDSKNA